MGRWYRYLARPFVPVKNKVSQVPFVDAFKLEAGRIEDTLIYMDINPLFET